MASFEDFDPLEVPLQESNLIEASAGTGKTFSIAIMVLRLVVEENIRVEEILMVTFTKAAVAELQERIRNFVREAEQCVQGEAIDNALIEEVVHGACGRESRMEIQKRLKSARMNLDELSVMTIHGFCQQSLNEFAFETHQLFSAELMDHLSLLLEHEIQQFWRNHITTIRPDLLQFLTSHHFTRDDMMQLLEGHLSGKKYLFYDETEKYTFTADLQSRYLDEILSKKEDVEEKEQVLIDDVTSHFDRWEARWKQIEGAKSGKDKMKEFIDRQEGIGFTYYLSKNKDRQYIQKGFPEIIERLDQVDQCSERYEDAIRKCIDYLYAFAIQEVTTGIVQHKTAKNLMSFDDMITRMASALKSGRGERLARRLREKYKAVFIDEFQDTDRQQYEIFNTAFHEANTLLFYIGDPKQSIYGWRKADIATYFEARNSVEHCYTMNTNFRSSPALVTALNHFFQPHADFDTFYFEGEKDRILYNRVEASNLMKKHKFQKSEVSCCPMLVTKLKNKDEIAEATADKVWELLTDTEYKIFNKEFPGGRPVCPSDIGILVRNKAGGQTIKKQLSRRHIPAVTMSDKKVLDSIEAHELVYVLEAMLTPDPAHINKSILTLFTGCQREDLLSMAEDQLVYRFKKYKESWEHNGVYTALRAWTADFNLQHYLLSGAAEDGERIITNLYHLLEILYQVENRRHLGPTELTGWLKSSFQKKGNEVGEEEQRIESDEEAVKITTIHKSKGLEYNIVIVPHLDFRYSKNRSIISFRNTNGEYITAHRSQLSESEIELHQRQEEQENRRLLYVALTRAVFQCILFKNKYKNTTLATFYTQIDIDGKSIQQGQQIDSGALPKYSPSAPKKQASPALPNHPVRGNHWWRMSYSSLSAHGNTSGKEPYSAAQDTYDYFVFKDLPKGARTGDLLHSILEKLPFTAPDQWKEVIHEEVRRSHSSPHPDFEARLMTLFQHVLETELPIGNEGIKLSTIPENQRLHEMEFNFPVGAFYPQNLEKLSPGRISVKSFSASEGVVTGFVDLFFEYKGRYYLIDWKSNYLGPELKDYNREGVAQAMTDSNYHLQYLLYTYAVWKYLQSRLGAAFDFERDFGGVIYLFLRGMRNGKSTGIFYTKPGRKQLSRIDSILNPVGVEGRIT